MENNFRDILSSMLADLDKGKSVDQIIAAKMKEANLTEKSQTRVEEAVEYVDRLDAAKQKLCAATSNGASRQEWLEGQIEKLSGALPEELQETAEEVLDKATKRYFENLDS